MPGLMDSHVHQAYESRFFGDRQGRVSLAWGITSTLSVGDQVYRAMEDRDSLRAGARVGPRFYATGSRSTGRGSTTTSCGRPRATPRSSAS